MGRILYPSTIRVWVWYCSTLPYPTHCQQPAGPLHAGTPPVHAAAPAPQGPTPADWSSATPRDLPNATTRARGCVGVRLLALCLRWPGAATTAGVGSGNGLLGFLGVPPEPLGERPGREVGGESLFGLLIFILVGDIMWRWWQRSDDEQIKAQKGLGQS
jgi:hypothetical protein